MREHHCGAVGCRALILSTVFMCERHLAMLQSDTRGILERKYRPGAKQTEVFKVVLERAREEILYFQLEGHRVPQAAEFEW